MKYLILLALVACQKESEIRAKVWRGGVHEIVRDLENNQEEYLETNDPAFKDFRCLHKKDAEKLIREALRYCNPKK